LHVVRAAFNGFPAGLNVLAGSSGRVAGAEHRGDAGEKHYCEKTTGQFPDLKDAHCKLPLKVSKTSNNGDGEFVSFLVCSDLPARNIHARIWIFELSRAVSAPAKGRSPRPGDRGWWIQGSLIKSEAKEAGRRG
jgi:hypothetical protein